VYIDDHRVVHRLPKSRVRCKPGHSASCAHCALDGGQLRDVVLSQQVDAAYLKVGADMSVDKEFRYAQTFDAWGTTLEGAAGRAAVRIDKRRQLARLCAAV